MKRLCQVLLPLLVLSVAVPAQAQQVNFGLATTIGEHEVIVGQPQNSSTPGAAVLFHRSLDGTWSEYAKLKASDGSPNDGFGGALAADAHTLLVGAPNAGSGRGAAYVFQRNTATGGWTEDARLSLDDETAAFGNAVALSGDVAVIAAPIRDEQTGAVYVFRRSNAGAWSESARLMGSDVQAGDRFGSGIALTDDRIFVGATRHNDRAGAVYVFRYNATTQMWDEEAKLANDDEALKSFGAAFLVHGDMLFVSAPGITPGGGQQNVTPIPGAVIAFKHDAAGATWTKQATLQAGDGAPMDLFGLSLASAGAHELIVGAPGVGQFNGAAYVFQHDMASDAWSQKEKLTTDEEGFAIFGISVASRSGVTVVGVPGAASGEGQAALFVRNGETGAWTATATISTHEPGLEAITGGQVNCADGMAAAFGCKDVDLAAFLPVQSLGGGRGVRLNDIWGWTDPETGKEYALVGRTDGTSFVDVTDPFNPIFVGDLPLTDGANSSSWRDVKVYQDHAFIVADNAGEHGMQVFDLRQLRQATNLPTTFEEAANYDGIHSAHNIVINEQTGFAFAVGSSGGGETCGGGLHIIDIREPEQPKFAGCFADTETGRNRTGYTHDAQCVIYNGPDAEHRGKEICFNANETALSIADVTDKDSTLALANAAYPNVGYSHQGWLTDDHRYFYLDDELDELQGKVDGTRTLIWDVTDLDDPQLVKEHLSENKASDHNLYIKGNLMYQSNYLSGLRIYDISDVTNPVEVAYFDTVPYGEDAPGFGGSWSNFPYFKSGTLVVTSMSEGLFILKKREVDI